MIKPKITNSQHKLLLLYLLKKIDIRLSETQILRVISEKDWMSYFDLETNLDTLAENHMINARRSVHGTFYSITEIGTSTLEYFEKELPHSLRTEIDEFCAENRDFLESEARLFAEYYSIGKDEFKVVLKILEEDSTLFELDIVVNTKAEAQRYKESWMRNANELYKHCHETLLLR